MHPVYRHDKIAPFSCLSLALFAYFEPSYQTYMSVRIVRFPLCGSLEAADHLSSLSTLIIAAGSFRARSIEFVNTAVSGFIPDRCRYRCSSITYSMKRGNYKRRLSHHPFRLRFHRRRLHLPSTPRSTTESQNVVGQQPRTHLSPVPSVTSRSPQLLLRLATKQP
jgi:hypothetical protein